jgi:hypothetical protein
MMSLRPITPIDITGLDTAPPETGEPICERVDPARLCVDPAYQRDIGERGLRKIRQMIEAWDWRKFSPPICAYAELEDGSTVLKVLDGQHTAIAAASHPDISMIPVMIVEAATTSDQAQAFVGQNTGRLAVTKLQLHRSAVVAGDEDALTVDQVCERAGVILLLQAGGKTYKPRETVAIAAIEKLVNDHSAMRARQILEVVAKADPAPLTAGQIKAAELLLTDPEYSEAFDAEDLTVAIRECAATADRDAALYAAEHRKPAWRGLATVWFRKVRKRRQPRAAA